MKSSYRTETHNETEKNYHYNLRESLRAIRPLAQRRPALRRERTDRHDCSHRLTGRTALYPHRTAERRGKR